MQTFLLPVDLKGYQQIIMGVLSLSVWVDSCLKKPDLLVFCVNKQSLI